MPQIVVVAPHERAPRYLQVGRATTKSCERLPTMPRCYYIYILTNRTHTLYTGVTNDIHRRIGEHRRGIASRFTSKYKINRLVYFEGFDQIGAAIAREKEIKGRLRSKKIALIESTNPKWTDLSRELLAEFEE